MSKHTNNSNSFGGISYGYNYKESANNSNMGIYKYDKPLYNSKEEPFLDIGYGMFYAANERKAKQAAKTQREKEIAHKKDEQGLMERARLIAIKKGELLPGSKVKDVTADIMCANCHEVVKDRDYCTECGAMLHPVECPHCEEIVPDGEFCLNCDKLLSRVKQFAVDIYNSVKEGKYKKGILSQWCCPNCLQPVHKEDKCSNCGYYLTNDMETLSLEDAIECPNCLSKVRSASICSECGYRLGNE